MCQTLTLALFMGLIKKKAYIKLTTPTFLFCNHTNQASLFTASGRSEDHDDDGTLNH